MVVRSVVISAAIKCVILSLAPLIASVAAGLFFLHAQNRVVLAFRLKPDQSLRVHSTVVRVVVPSKNLYSAISVLVLLIARFLHGACGDNVQPAAAPDPKAMEEALSLILCMVAVHAMILCSSLPAYVINVRALLIVTFLTGESGVPAARNVDLVFGCVLVL